MDVLWKIIENAAEIWYYWIRSLKEFFIEKSEREVPVSIFLALFNGG
jgi:hypothetical protein